MGTVHREGTLRATPHVLVLALLAGLVAGPARATEPDARDAPGPHREVPIWELADFQVDFHHRTLEPRVYRVKLNPDGTHALDSAERIQWEEVRIEDLPPRLKDGALRTMRAQLEHLRTNFGHLMNPAPQPAREASYSRWLDLHAGWTLAVLQPATEATPGFDQVREAVRDPVFRQAWQSNVIAGMARGLGPETAATHLVIRPRPHPWDGLSMYNWTMGAMVDAVVHENPGCTEGKGHLEILVPDAWPTRRNPHDRLRNQDLFVISNKQGSGALTTAEIVGIAGHELGHGREGTSGRAPLPSVDPDTGVRTSRTAGIERSGGAHFAFQSYQGSLPLMEAYAHFSEWAAGTADPEGRWRSWEAHREVLSQAFDTWARRTPEGTNFAQDAQGRPVFDGPHPDARSGNPVAELRPAEAMLRTEGVIARILIDFAGLVDVHHAAERRFDGRKVVHEVVNAHYQGGEALVTLADVRAEIDRTFPELLETYDAAVARNTLDRAARPEQAQSWADLLEAMRRDPARAKRHPAYEPGMGEDVASTFEFLRRRIETDARTRFAGSDRRREQDLETRRRARGERRVRDHSAALLRLEREASVFETAMRFSDQAGRLALAREAVNNHVLRRYHLEQLMRACQEAGTPHRKAGYRVKDQQLARQYLAWRESATRAGVPEAELPATLEAARRLRPALEAHPGAPLPEAQRTGRERTSPAPDQTLDRRARREAELAAGTESERAARRGEVPEPGSRPSPPRDAAAPPAPDEGHASGRAIEAAAAARAGALQDAKAGFLARMRANPRLAPLAGHANFFLATYVFTLLRLSHQDPSLPIEEHLAAAGRLAFAPEALGTFLLFLAVDRPFQLAAGELAAVGQALSAEASQAARTMFRLGARAVGAAGTFASLFVTDGVMQLSGVIAEDQSESSRRAAILGLMQTPEGRQAIEVSRTWFEMDGQDLIRSAFDPGRVDYLLLAAQGAAMVAAGAASEAAGLGPAGIWIAIAAAEATAHVIEVARSEGFTRSAYSREIADMVDEARRELGTFSMDRPLGESVTHELSAWIRSDPRHANAYWMSRQVKVQTRAYRTLSTRGSQSLLALQACREALEARLFEAAVFAWGRNGYYRELERHYQRVLRQRPEAARAAYARIPRAFREFDPEHEDPADELTDLIRLEGRWLREGASPSRLLELDQVRTETGTDRTPLVDRLIGEVNAFLAELGTGSPVWTGRLLRESHLGSLARTLHMHRAKASDELHGAGRVRRFGDESNDARIAAFRRQGGLPPGFELTLEIHRRVENEDLGVLLAGFRESEVLVAAPLNASAMLTAARILWQAVLHPWRDRVPEDDARFQQTHGLRGLRQRAEALYGQGN